MFFIPYGHIQIKSKLGVDEIERRLKSQLDSHSILSGTFRGNHKYLQGKIENGEFKISRIINYRNSFRPVIQGRLEPDLNHTNIELTFRLDFVVIAILLFISLGFAGNFILPIFTILMYPSLFSGTADYFQYFPEGYWLKLILSTLGGFLFFYLFVMIPFNLEANKVIKYLEELTRTQQPSTNSLH